MGMRGQPTINDVAERAGVSKSLVSLVMSGTGSVSAERTTAVLAAAAELGYRPNAAAKSLVRGRSFVIGMILSDLHNPFFADVVDGVDTAASEEGYRALLNTGFRVPSREAAAVDTFLQYRVDGLILAGTQLDAETIRAAAASTPVIELAARTGVTGVDSITTDDFVGARLATEHLLQLGHRRIAHLTGSEGPSSQQRKAGFEATMTEAGPGVVMSTAAGDFTEDGGAAGIGTLFDHGADLPTAVFASNDFSAIGAMSALEERGFSIPGDVSVIGYDNSSLAGLRHIGLTSINQPRHEMGRLAVEFLLERLDGGRGRARHTVLEPSLVVRQTTAAPPIRASSAPS